jgi:hypothetical protein
MAFTERKDLRLRKVAQKPGSVGRKDLVLRTRAEKEVTGSVERVQAIVVN